MEEKKLDNSEEMILFISQLMKDVDVEELEPAKEEIVKQKQKIIESYTAKEEIQKREND